MTGKRIAEIYCEGYHDRSFISGWLLSRNLSDPDDRGGGKRKPVFHPLHDSQQSSRNSKVSSTRVVCRIRLAETILRRGQAQTTGKRPCPSHRTR